MDNNRILRVELKLLTMIISKHSSNKNMTLKMSHFLMILRLKLIFQSKESAMFSMATAS